MKKPKLSRNRVRIPDPLHIALEKLEADEAIKAEARYFLIECNWAKLKSRTDFERAFASLAACQTLLAPIHPNYRGCLDLLRKGLVSYQKMLVAWEKTWTEEDVRRVWNEVCDLLKEHLKPEIWRAVGAKMEALFSGSPPRA